LSDQSSVSSSGGLGSASILTIVFIVLKLIGVISWSWLWVLSPLWISFLLFVVILIFVALVGLAIMSKSDRQVLKDAEVKIDDKK